MGKNNLMEYKKAKKLVIVTEASILDKVLEDITKLGAKGYTVQDATGKGERGIRSQVGILGEIFKNYRIEIVTNENIAKEISEHMLEKYFVNYAGIVYMEDIETLQSNKFNII